MKNRIQFRCSALSNIMTIDRATQLTDNQKKELDGLLDKIQLTEKQAEKRDYLISKRDAPDQLSQGAKTYVKDVFFGQRFDFEKRFTNKFVQKGNICEDRAINEVIKHLGLPMVIKNEDHFRNDFIKGTPDTIFKPLNFQLDIKNVFYPNGLDSFEEECSKNYEWQMHGYNWLTGVDHGFVVKVLMNPPESILEKEAYILMKEAGLNSMTDSFFEEVRELYNFERKPIEDRIKIFKVTTDQKHIDQIKKCVNLANDYYNELEEAWSMKNNSEVEFIKSLKP